jgi:hypothetical protein
MTRARLRGVATLALTACALLASTICACATDAARTTRTARTAERHGVICQRKHGRTIFHHGIVRAFKSSGTVFGCVDGSTHAWPLWGSTDAPYETVSGSILQVSGRFVAFETETGVKGSNDWSIEVADLRSGDGYGVAYWSQTVPFDEQPSPVTSPVQALVLGPDGRTACLEEVFDANVAPSASEPFPSRQVLVLLGFHHFHRRLAISVPGGIVPGSVAYDGQTVTWTQNGSAESANV